MPELGKDFYDRAAAVLGATANGVHWPYEANGVPSLGDPNFQEKLAAVDRIRLMMVEWAEQHGLKKSTVKCCPAWLTRPASRRCAPGTCTRSDSTGPDHGWLDHRVHWLKDGRPAVITSSPYGGLSATEKERIAWWLQQHANLRSVQGRGWYLPGSTQIVMWRADRIDEVRLAGEDRSPRGKA